MNNNIGSTIQKKIDEVAKRAINEKTNEVIQKVKMRFDYEKSVFVNENASAARVYDKDSAEVKQFDAYKWVFDNVDLVPELNPTPNGVTITLKASLKEGETFDDYRTQKFSEILNNVIKKNSYGF